MRLKVMGLMLPPPLVHIFVLGFSLFCITYCFWIFTKRKEIHAKRKLVTIELLLIFLLAVIVLGVAGYERIAILVFDTVLLLLVFTLIVWLMQKMISAMLELMLLDRRFRSFVKMRPQWYNALTGNCTTSIRQHTMPYDPDGRLDWRLIVNGYIDEMLYESEAINTYLPITELKKQSYINSKAQAADKDPEFSQLIRVGLPGKGMK